MANKDTRAAHLDVAKPWANAKPWENSLAIYDTKNLHRIYRMPESWVQCVTRVYKLNKAKHGKDADGKFKYKLKDAMKDAKKEYKSAGKENATNTRKAKKGGSKKRSGRTAKYMGGEEKPEL